MRHLILTLEAPLMSFGGETIDNLGVIRPFPSASMLTGLLANALGWRRVDRERHQSLQDRLIFAARIDREPSGGMRMRDNQNVHIGDTVDLFVRNNHWVVGWTTRGEPDERAGALGAAGSGPFTHRRWRDFYADTRVTVALRLEPAHEDPKLDRLAEKLKEPARPLFIGRKPCLPSERVFSGYAEGDSALAALLAWPLRPTESPVRGVKTIWPEGEGAAGIEPTQTQSLTDERNWVSGLHGGGRVVCQRAIESHLFAEPQPI